MSDHFIDPENGKPYFFAGGYSFELDSDPDRDICAVCASEIRADGLWYGEPDNEDGSPVTLDSDLIICDRCRGWGTRVEIMETFGHENGD